MDPHVALLSVLDRRVLPRGDAVSGRAGKPTGLSQVEPQGRLEPSAVDPSREKLRSLYSPEQGRIACVLLQAAYGGSREPCRWFGPGDWETGIPDKTFGWIDLTREEWRYLGMLSRAERIEAWRAHSDSDASLAEDPKGLSGEAVAARAEGIAK